MSDVDPRRYEDLIAAYALDALPEDEQREIEEHLAEHPELQIEVDELRSVADMLAFVPEDQEPPPELRRNILSAIEPEGETPETGNERSSGWLGGWFGFPRLAFAASVLVMVAGLLTWNLTLQGEVRELQGRIENTPEAPRTYEVSGSGMARTASGEVMELENGRTVLMVEGLPEAPQSKTYQIWLIEGNEPIPSNVFESTEGTTAAALDQPLDGADVVAVTVEPEGGSESPTSDPILTSEL